ncbi:hypothetical protein BDP27DRAFT_1427901 [Rhodocollybia butyracea]|uniref:Uncharacterized protein n=1 Tax=Rhodocollybia butyracea TaxID=206335 RepID=A0A9P5U111_9AGAR|nr:hypothetical protein BDP27DRAFT_1427901 [Rhodocollybia butyracea]
MSSTLMQVDNELFAGELTPPVIEDFNTPTTSDAEQEPNNDVDDEPRREVELDPENETHPETEDDPPIIDRSSAPTNDINRSDTESEPDSDTTESLLDATDVVVEEIIDSSSSIGAARLHYLAQPCTEIPDPTAKLTHGLRRMPNTGDQALHLVDGNHDIATHTIIGRIAFSDGSSYGPNFLGGYLDMKLFHKQEVSLDNDHTGYPDAQSTINKANKIFNDYNGYKVGVHDEYLDTRRGRDDEVFGPDNISGNPFVKNTPSGYAIPIITAPVFVNVPKRGTTTRAKLSSGESHSRVLRPFEEVQKEQRKKNLEVFTNAESGNDPSRITIGSWPDPEGIIFALGETTDLGAIRIAPSTVYGKDGTQIHPLDWEDTLIPNSEVAVSLTSHLWDITYDRGSGHPLPNPSLHCVNLAKEIHLLPTTREDVTSLYRSHALTIRKAAQENAVQLRLAKTQHLTIRGNEEERLKQITRNSTEAAARNNERLNRLTALYSKGNAVSKLDANLRQPTIPLTTADTDTTLRALAVPDDDTPGAGPSIPKSSPLKRVTADSTITPKPKKKRQTHAAATENPDEIRKTTRNRTRSSKDTVDDKGKSKAVDYMNVD